MEACGGKLISNTKLFTFMYNDTPYLNLKQWQSCKKKE